MNIKDIDTPELEAIYTVLDESFKAIDSALDELCGLSIYETELPDDLVYGKLVWPIEKATRDSCFGNDINIERLRNEIDAELCEREARR